MTRRLFEIGPTWPSRWALFVSAVGLCVLLASPGLAQQTSPPHETSQRSSSHDASLDQRGIDHQSATGALLWEGSPAGIAYSEFNHHFSGIFILLVGMTELWGALGIGLLGWSRFLLPLAMLGAGGHLLIWSDHEAWPIGSLSFAQTFFGGDWEML